MKHIRLFEDFKGFDDHEYRDTEFNKFRGIDIEDIHKLSFAWSNAPFISDYKMSNGDYGSSEKRIDINDQIRSILSNIDKEEFRKILEKNFNVEIRSSGSVSIESISPSYNIVLEGQDILAFFDLLENINFYIS